MLDLIAQPERPAQAGKLRLNADQWRTLERLATTPKEIESRSVNLSSGRLTSNGLVALDHRGFAYLTILGLQRLNQGR
ncbi:hypothetical protein [Variovorax sp. Sphag1AA]|uniref:hypothetical protein n=1 Tax=Variovorax sp. Sphag1AA TaxID=2587027 RepID=UPI00162250AA|nr:hypothetical protein [Variovorax sp. Sphag1AA]MBB3181010.1 hypothetical protein [Variovorax sp. Sphag1AA]